MNAVQKIHSPLEQTSPVALEELREIQRYTGTDKILVNVLE